MCLYRMHTTPTPHVRTDTHCSLRTHFNSCVLTTASITCASPEVPAPARSGCTPPPPPPVPVPPPFTLHPSPSTLHPPPSSTAPLLPPDQGTPAHLVSVFLVLPPLRHTSAYERDCLWAPCISASFPSFSLSLLPFQLPFPPPTFPLPPPLPPLPPALRRRREGSRQPFLSPEVQFHFLDFRDEWTCKKQRKFFTFSWISTRQRSAGA